MESNRNPSGLGRGLAGILGDALSAAPSAGVGRLVGAQELRRSPRVRQMVTETALSMIADGFSADGVVVVRRDGSGGLAAVTSKLPSGWTALSPTTFEIVGRLWSHLERGDDVSVAEEVDTHHFLLCRHSGFDGPMAAAVVRSTPFEEREVETIGNLVRSVGAALGEPFPLPPDNKFRVLTQRTSEGVLADLRVGVGDDRRHAASVAADEVTAVARAAAELCDVPLEVSFAGATEVDGNVATLVVVIGPLGGPLFGLAVDEPESSTGPAEAVFAAARVLRADPFAKVSAEG